MALDLIMGEHVRSPSWLEQAISDAQKTEKIPKPPATVLDLGCGDGTAALSFAANGYDTYGIDLNRILIEEAKRMAQKNPRMKFEWGNYLPRDIIARTTPAQHVLLQETPDPYEALGKMPNQFDIFFIFPWPGQMDSVFDFFRTHAKKGARLLALGAEEDWQYWGDPGIDHEGTVPLAEDARRYTVYKK